MAQALEYATFAVLVAANLSLGLYFSFRKTSSGTTTTEVFLGSRALKIFPLAASAVASVISSAGLVGFPAHFYAYGWHVVWASLPPLLLLPLAAGLIVPVLYKLGISSIFEYIRMRFNTIISMTACAAYIFLTQSVAAISIFAASLTLVTVFNAPLHWSNIAIGLSATIYTALGGLRGVVWTDCMQFLFIVCAPAIVVGQIMYESLFLNSTIQPVSDLEVRKYIADYRLNLMSDENIWACILGMSGIALYRLCFDQVVTQRLLASRTVHEAQRTTFTTALLVSLMYVLTMVMGASLTIWFRGCDPGLLGVINSIDQILPYYINNYMIHVPGFCGIFMAGVVCAATSTISSVINSQATILYVDFIAPRWNKAEHNVLLITRSAAVAFGLIITLYSTLCAYMGPITGVFLMVYTSVTAPFVGLCILAILFPFVHCKGAGAGAVVTIVYQLWHMVEKLRSGKRPPRMPVSLDYCPVHVLANVRLSNVTVPTQNTMEGIIPQLFFASRVHPVEEVNVLLLWVDASTFDSRPGAVYDYTFPPEDTIFIFRLSHMWSSFFSIFATIIIGVLISAITGEIKKSATPELCNHALVRMLGCRKKPPESNNKDVNNVTNERKNNQDLILQTQMLLEKDTVV